MAIKKFGLKIHLLCIILFVCFSSNTHASDNDEQLGFKLYTQNCKSCHNSNRFTIGPSLVEIKNKYPKEKLSAFLAWANNPGKVNPNTIQMPPMSHVGEENLKIIHKYILLTTKFLKERKAKERFKYKAATKTYPYVKRGMLSFSSPASIVVGLSSKLAIVWDPVICKVRYAFPGKYDIFGTEREREEKAKEIIYTEQSSSFLSSNDEEKCDFKGYRIVNKLPTFIYSIGKAKITESIKPGKSERSFIRNYKIQNYTGSIKYTLNEKQPAEVSVINGAFENNRITILSEQLNDFSIEVRIP